jgi:cytochrome c peroxidase
MRAGPRLAAVLLCAAAPACDTGAPVDAPGPGAAPALATPNLAVGAPVGQTLRYDASREGTTFTGDGLQYLITFEGDANGLAATGATLAGEPLAPGVTWATLTATDAMGRTASDRFAVVAYRAGLAVPNLPATPFRYADATAPLPPHYRGPALADADNTPANNPITDAGAVLGRVLFYDPRLSANNRLSCAGCHGQFLGFADSPPQSAGFEGGLTPRHSPALVNARFYRPGRFFRDERAATLEAQVLQPIQDPVEMGMTLRDALAKIQAAPYYPELFTAAFGSPAVTDDRVARALAQYVRSLVSADSRFDRAFTGGPVPDFASVFTPREIEGERLFRSAGCVACHTTVAQVGDAVHNNGLDAVSTDPGAGRGAFKAPSLRNAAVRHRFMHDGRFATLEQVVEFYDSGVQPNPDLDPRLRNPDGSPRRLNLTAAQREALVAFLHTLTDSTFLRAPRFADPFVLPGTTSMGAATMQGTAFHPARLTVRPNATVSWTNLDNLRHSVSFSSAAIGAIPTFTSGTQRLTMPAARGTYHYQCAVHGAAMSGTVIVQ